VACVACVCGICVLERLSSRVRHVTSYRSCSPVALVMSSSTPFLADVVTLPRTLADCTWPWLAAALNAPDLAEEHGMPSFTLLTGGFNATVARLNALPPHSATLIDAPMRPLPSSLVLKLSTEDNAKELAFYGSPIFSNIAADAVASASLSASTPRLRGPLCYGAHRRARRYCFILEDLSTPYFRLLSQHDGISLDDAVVVTRAYARFHALNWHAEERLDASSRQTLFGERCPHAASAAADDPKIVSTLCGLMAEGLDDFEALVASELGELAVPAGAAARLCAKHFGNILARQMESHMTLLHGDARASNLFLTNFSSLVVAVDWQGFCVGSGPSELAYLLSMSLHDSAHSSIDALMRLYYDTLLASPGGPTQSHFSFASFAKAFTLGMVTSSLVPVWLSPKLIAARRTILGKRPAGLPPQNETVVVSSRNLWNEIWPMARRWALLAVQLDLVGNLGGMGFA
jgi:hypothetical protein